MIEFAGNSDWLHQIYNHSSSLEIYASARRLLMMSCHFCDDTWYSYPAPIFALSTIRLET